MSYFISVICINVSLLLLNHRECLTLCVVSCHSPTFPFLHCQRYSLMMISLPMVHVASAFCTFSFCFGNFSPLPDKRILHFSYIMWVFLPKQQKFRAEQAAFELVSVAATLVTGIHHILDGFIDNIVYFCSTVSCLVVTSNINYVYFCF